MIIQKNTTIYINYFFSFIGSISFLVIANFLELKNLEKYILILSISTVFASIIYSSSIKSKLEDNIIKISFTKDTIKILSILLLFIIFYLIFKENYFLAIFFISTVIYEFCFNLFAISFIKRNNSLDHSKFLLLTSILKNLCLCIFVFTFDLLKIVLIFYILYSLIFLFFFKKLKIFFKRNNKSFNIKDFFYILSGSLIFQIDKILGESFLSRNEYITYFLIFKFASLFQIIGNLLTQPIRNNLISIEKVSKEVIKQLNRFTVLLIILLLSSNFMFVILNELVFFNNYIFEINYKNIFIFNFLSLAIITHIYNGFYLDSLFINNFSKVLFKINLFIIFFILLSLFFFKYLILWSFVMFLAQIMLLLLSFINYQKYVR